MGGGEGFSTVPIITKGDRLPYSFLEESPLFKKRKGYRIFSQKRSSQQGGKKAKIRQQRSGQKKHFPKGNLGNEPSEKKKKPT